MTSGLPSKILKDGIEVTDSKFIACAFNNFFVNIGNNLAISVPINNRCAMSLMPSHQPSSIYLNTTTSKEIEDEIDMLNSSKATGPYNIPVKILKLLKAVIYKYLESIFNCFLSIGAVPDIFKIASVIPI